MTDKKIDILRKQLISKDLGIPESIHSEKRVNLKDIFCQNPDQKLYLSKEKTQTILTLANLPHKDRIKIYKDRLCIPDGVVNKIKHNTFIQTNHLGQNGGLTSNHARTITTIDVPHIVDTSDYKNPKIRRLTLNECERLMNWPIDWTKYGVNKLGEKYEVPEKERIKKIGNGIVSSVSKAVADSLTNGEKEVKVISLCSGVDGSCLLFDKDKYKHSGFFEIEEHASSILKYHYPDVVNYGDLTQLNVELPDFDLLFASLPCQSFSLAGKCKGDDDERGKLYLDMIKILQTKRPKYIIFENVPNITGFEKNKEDKGKTISKIVNEFKNCGYDIDFKILNSLDFNSIQGRKRFFMVGKLITST